MIEVGVIERITQNRVVRYNIDVIEVEPDETQYKFIKLKDEEDDEPGDWEDYLEPGDPITLTTGYYKFLDDGITIMQIVKTHY